MKFLNRYTFFARYIPGLISIFPLTLLYFFLTKKYSNFELKEYFESVTFLLGISATFILTFFVSMIVREFGSFLEAKYFKNKQGFPTSYLMLYLNDKISYSIKQKYRAKINNDFGVNLFNEQEEENNTQEALKLLNHATGLLCTKYQQNEQVKDANIAYGFSRNVSGGLFLSIPTVLISLIIGFILKDNSLILWSSFSLVVFFLIEIYHRKWIVRNAEKYAEKLYSIYLGDN